MALVGPVLPTGCVKLFLKSFHALVEAGNMLNQTFVAPLNVAEKHMHKIALVGEAIRYT